MTSLLNVEKVKYQCSCGTFKSLCYLYFCRHCLKIKCKDCVILEVDCRFCPSCYEHLQSHEAITRKNRCQNCFSCPCCNHTLVTRATNTSSTLSAHLNQTTDMSHASGDADESLSSSTNVSGLQTPSKKVYYLACSVCRWSTRDIRLPDQPSLNSWKAQENIHEGRFNELLQHYKQIATREKQERDRKRYSTAKLRNSMVSTTSRSMDKYGVLAPLTRRGIQTNGMLKAPTLSESPTITTNLFPKPAEPIEQIEPLDETFYLSSSFDFNKLTTITQRLNSVEIQPLTTDRLYPIAKHFTSKQSKRCKECDHNVLKPEPSPKLIKFKLHQMALFFIPEIRIWHHPNWILNEKNTCILSIVNQLDEQLTLKIYSFDEIRDENLDKELIDKINCLDQTILTSQMYFPLEKKQRSIELHAHVEQNETDTKIDDELRRNDPKDLVVYRKFAKIGVKCFIQIKTIDVKKILSAFIVEHRVNGISSIVSTPTATSPNPITQNIRHIVLIDFGGINEPALPLHSALA